MEHITIKEWLNIGKEKFGNYKDFKFKCPACGNIASVKDFIELRADPNNAYQMCIGRVNGKGSRFLGSKAKATDTFDNGCDWAAFGFFMTLEKGYKVMNNDGIEVNVFPYAE